jgi:hypothetical protein
LAVARIAAPVALTRSIFSERMPDDISGSLRL